MKVAVIGSFPKSLINFRGELIKKISSKNYEVVCLASHGGESIAPDLTLLGGRFYGFWVSRNGLNPLSDTLTFFSLGRFFLREKPSVCLAYTVKPVIWGGLASFFLPNLRFYALITGLGFAFEGKSFKRRILTILVSSFYRLSLLNAEKVIFQNQDNRNFFLKNNIIPKSKCIIVNGSGVNLDFYEKKNINININLFSFLAVGRLLGEKGFREYIEAAKIVKKVYPTASFKLLGPEDPSHDGISLEEVESWHDQGFIEYLGSTDDVRLYLKKCTVFVLPSYHEGMPRTVLEAMATGRPILTTDVPGCRETVIEGENGFLVPKADAEALAERMIWFIENQDQLQRMGDRSRELAEEKYDVHKVNAQLMEIMGL